MNKRQDFWSRRKAAVLSEQEAYARAEEMRAEKMNAEAQAEKSDDEILAELDLPDPDSLALGDDFRAFMTKAVPDRIRRRALRRLWITNPALANLDGLIDYGEDFTDSATVIENLQTAYQVGKGMMTHVEEMARQATEESASEDQPELTDADESEEEFVADTALTTEEEITPSPSETVKADENTESAGGGDDHMSPAPKRRMHFVFGDEFGGRA